MATLGFYVFMYLFYFLVLVLVFFFCIFLILLRVFSLLVGTLAIFDSFGGRALSKLKVYEKHCQLGESLRRICGLYPIRHLINCNVPLNF